MATDKKFINGMFVTEKNGNYGPFFKIGIKKETFLQSINAIETDDRGFFNLVMTAQQNDKSKFSVYVDEWKPTQQAAQAAPPPSKPGTLKGTPPPAPADLSGDDLPF